MTLTRNVLILGGGMAGMSAGKTLAAGGYSVHLVEKEEQLGGKAQQWACMATDQCQNCGACLSAELVDQTQRLQHIQIYTQTQLSRITRCQDGFSATLTGKNTTEIQVDAVLLSTGFALFDPTGFQSLGYGRNKKVITTAQMNRALKRNHHSQLFEGKQNPAVAFIQCVGSRNREIGRDYCSQVCCKTTLRQANKVLHLYPAAQLSLFHMDLQIIGKEFRNQYTQLAQHIDLLQGVPAEILTGYEKDKLTVIREDSESGARLAHHFDLIVLAVGMGPAEGTSKLLRQLELIPDDWGFCGNAETILPKGVYLAGSLHGPMDILTAKAQGQVAANQIIRDFSTASTKGKIAVLGQGIEGRQVAATLAASRSNVILIDRDTCPHLSDETVQVFDNSTLTRIQGVVGDFQLSVSGPKGSHEFTADALVVANGVDQYFPQDTIGIPAAATVMALGRFDAQFKENHTLAPKRIVFWLDHSGPEWKENCRKALLWAGELADEHKSITVLMDKMLVHGLNGQRTYDQIRGKGVKFLRLARDSHPQVHVSDTGVLLTLKEASLPAVELELHCDCLVISEKIVPRTDNAIISRSLAIACDKDGFLQPANVRQQPVGSYRKGIFFGGSCHEEADATDLRREIKVIRAALDSFDHRPADNDSFPQIKEGHCVKCLTCLRICPHGAITLKAFRQPIIHRNACFNCGLCVANCPAEAIDPLKLPPDFCPGATSLPTVIFACQRSGALAAGQAIQMGLCKEDDVELITLACACRLNVETLLAPLASGSRQVMIAACHSGNCRSEVGPENAAAKITRIFSEMQLPPGMLSYHSLAANEPAAFAALITGKNSR